jgi:uncharacterized Fe-S cluster-containing radical SAM superfamily protein
MKSLSTSLRPPSVIQIDASAHCQLACPSCPTADGSVRPAMGAGHLDPLRFEELLDRNPEIAEVELSNYGEMFLNPRLTEIMRIAAERKVVLHAENGTNMNHVSDDVLEALVTHRFRSITVSIDGAGEESYARYRVRGSFGRVIDNIRKINSYKRKHGAAFPLLSWQFIVFGHNEHEIAAAKKMAAGLGMVFRPKISWDDALSPIRDPRLVQIQTGLPATRAEFHQTRGVDVARHICYQLWNQPVLNWDGRLMGCCRNFWGDFGTNAFDAGLSAALGSPMLETAKQMLIGKADAEPGIPCTTCDLYRTLRANGKWITAEEIGKSAGDGAVLAGVVVDAGDSGATHADIFILPGHNVNRLAFVQPPAAVRCEFAVSCATAFVLRPGNYTVYVLPKRLDPTFRTQYPAITPVTAPITVAERPRAQEFRIGSPK